MESLNVNSSVKEELDSDNIEEFEAQAPDVLKIELLEVEEHGNERVANEGNSPSTDFWEADEIEVSINEIPKLEAVDETFCYLPGDGMIVTFKCGVCEFTATTEISLMRHMRSHNVQRACPICGLLTFAKFELERHLANTHAKEVPYICEHCQHGFFRLSSFATHDCRKRPKLCQHCGADFKTKSKLREHIKNSHRNDSVVPKKRYCQHCEFSCWSGDSLNAHLRTHLGNKTLHCPHCVFEFSKLPSLQRHLKIHKKETSFSCPYCGAIFAKYGVVKIHMELHKDRDLHCCTDCSFTTSSRTNLKSHRSRVHNPNKHKCPHCDYETAAIYRYKVHLLSHEEASLCCTQCDYKTKYKWDLKRHTQKHEKNPDYRCPHCGLFCSSLDSLKHHATRHSAHKLPVPDFIGSL